MYHLKFNVLKLNIERLSKIYFSKGEIKRIMRFCLNVTLNSITFPLIALTFVSINDLYFHSLFHPQLLQHILVNKLSL
jgi:hypothetical protein